jgi:mRNA interferase MazF
LGTNRGKTAYIPDRGDIIWLNFTPQAGREQAGRRPALVLSPHSYNSRTGLCQACPITSHAKGYPFEVALYGSHSIQGVILVDHMRSCDWRVREAKLEEQVGEEILDPVKKLLRVLLID